ncbi:MAG: hypothetical protein JWN56_593 [Sphingobacteriales bacterium]|nr:hypothetical protein [Sphingobacteriales bacterium]
MIRWKRLLLIICLIGQIPRYSFSQQLTSGDTLSKDKEPQLDTINSNGYQQYQDSISLARSQFVRDSLKAFGDSLARVWVGAPDPNRPNRFIDSLINLYTIKSLHFEGWAKNFKKRTGHYNEGRLKPHGEKWVVITTFSLLFLLGLIKFIFPKEFSLLIEAFYNNRILGQLNKEDNVLGSWPFIFMLLLFGLTIGMFLYLSGKYLLLKYSYDGFQWFLILSVLIIGLFVIKIIMLLLMGFFFEIEKLVKEYISILYLSYFNTSIVLIPLVIALCLAPSRFSAFYIYLTAILLGLIFLFQFLRAGTNILTTYRFPKVYLILYLCALEICPLLILIKALRF